ncbi:hypothetical protein [Bifidobacterium merycicum]|uniref:Uncharacterized protein n=1 Tax=Bifidobacterium merycicum TaxID=78345 RepID=A0A087BGS6_9BIFI|nr:hypothetical protein [Bifidobacterium merycicum]KFI70226.1 hypothetical protein BMERY_0705 [Bifidobacterium merycicum]SHE84685.1 hypothetical protein SAMN02745589_0009 [Bifidobacterium merycicum DSM 6492]
MKLDVIYFSGAWWLDTEHAAVLLRISPDSLRRNRTKSIDLRTIDCTIWHHVSLWRLDDVVRVSQTRMQAAAISFEASEIAGDFAR